MKFKDSELSKDSLIYILLIIIPSIVLSFYSWHYIALGLILVFIALVVSSIRAKKYKDTLSQELMLLSSDFDSVSKHAIFNMPFPLVLIDDKGIVVWHNTPFQKMIEKDMLVNQAIVSFCPELDMEKIEKAGKEDQTKETILRVSHKGKLYDVHCGKIKSSNLNSDRTEINMLYFIDSTDLRNTESELEEKRVAVGLVFVDNYDDIRNSMTDINRSLLFSELDNVINNAFQDPGGIVKKYEKDKYLVLIERGSYKQMESKKFEVLDRARELYFGNSIPVTLSIGICADYTTPFELFERAESSVNVALGRGGDQAVVEVEGQFKFYGGKTKAVEKRNKVKARVISYALRQLIETSDNVFVMGHKNPDMDSIGSAIGVLRAIEDCDKKGYLITEGENPSIKNLYEKLRNDGTDILMKFLQPENVKEYVSSNSLLIVVDNHKPSMVESPEMLNLIPRTVVIDHHRRGTEFISEPLLIYLEPYASSTSELVTEILTYFSEKINLTKLEAECLLAGITVDTKNFTFQTGVRTFEAASTLKRCGADSTVVSQLFRDEYENVMTKARVLQDSKIIHDKIAISRLDRQTHDSVLIAAEAANELLNINGIEASFVITEYDEKVYVSGRSYGNISVQLIMEKLGGGGHLTSAGSQFTEMTVDDVEKKLIETIDAYLKEEKEDENNIAKGR